MPEPRKSRQPGAEPARPSRDPRIDSTPPASFDEAPLAHLQHVAHTFSRPTAAPPNERLANLEAEVVRLRDELASDADDTAGMLVKIAESERLRVSVHAMAIEAGARAGALETELERASQRVRSLEGELERTSQRVRALEVELEGLRSQWSLSEARLSVSRRATEAALALIEELERREEMAAGIRARTVRDALQALRGDTIPPESSVEVTRGPDSAPDAEWDLDLAK
jgi:predicted RNase H-like nuclease (RuvC/YqgF family)